MTFSTLQLLFIRHTTCLVWIDELRGVASVSLIDPRIGSGHLGQLSVEVPEM